MHPSLVLHSMGGSLRVVQHCTMHCGMLGRMQRVPLSSRNAA